MNGFLTLFNQRKIFPLSHVKIKLNRCPRLNHSIGRYSQMILVKNW
jgi:hypothetical protein